MIYVANGGFVTAHKGQRVRVRPGDTVEEGHWLLDAVPGSFRPLEITYPAERKQDSARHEQGSSTRAGGSDPAANENEDEAPATSRPARRRRTA